MAAFLGMTRSSAPRPERVILEHDGFKLNRDSWLRPLAITD
jgi:hypothetical protein